MPNRAKTFASTLFVLIVQTSTEFSVLTGLTKDSLQPASATWCLDTEYCGKAETHDYQRYLAVNAIEHTKTQVKSTQTNGICERFHRTILNEFYPVTFRKTLYADLNTLQRDLDAWIQHYNTERIHQGKMCCGRTPMATLYDGKQPWEDKNLSPI